MVRDRIKSIGLFYSNPRSRRVEELTKEFGRLEVDVVSVVPWMIARKGSTGSHGISVDDIDLSDLERLLVLDLGAHELGSFLNRIGLLSALSDAGVEVINSVRSLLQMRNKAESMRSLVSNGLPVPETLVSESIDTAAEFVRKHFPCIIKPLVGFGGEGVQLIKDPFDLEHIFDYLKFYGSTSSRGVYLLQEFIQNPGYDIRALVINDQVVSTMQRVSEDGITTNIHSGGIPRENDIDVTELALKAASSVDGQIVGVDIIPDDEGKLWVLEVNATPGWTGLQRVTEFNLSARIADLMSRTS